MDDVKVCLTIAGSDSGGGAGIQADIKAMQANGVFATSVLTAITAQNTREVTDSFDLPVGLIESQIDAVIDDFQVAATKTGMLSSVEIIEVVAEKISARNISPLVVDPVMISKSGFKLLKDDAVDVLKTVLLPLATLVTPNAHEAALLTGFAVESEEDARKAAEAIVGMGPGAVLVKGGHLEKEDEAIDVLFDGTEFHSFREDRIDTPHTHGTGCTYAAAITANLAKGYPLRVAVARSKLYVTKAIRAGLPLGSGHGPTDHFYYLRAASDFPFG
ncbi:MAG: bifunctional hydroxymethylpyrimidine kinase/phosphomethylpyrimidine kinase [Bacteroidetes bacterium]|nr:MAG: bifunctional hydroxymethylpyrimidine kinase/phosphomethylpyrimidine kinase [Bacteroidota bacterium]